MARRRSWLEEAAGAGIEGNLSGRGQLHQVQCQLRGLLGHKWEVVGSCCAVVVKEPCQDRSEL